MNASCLVVTSLIVLVELDLGDVGGALLADLVGAAVDAAGGQPAALGLGAAVKGVSFEVEDGDGRFAETYSHICSFWLGWGGAGGAGGGGGEPPATARPAKTATMAAMVNFIVKMGRWVVSWLGDVLD